MLLLWHPPREPRQLFMALNDPLLDDILVGTVVNEVPRPVGDLAGRVGRRPLAQALDELQLEGLDLLERLARRHLRQRLPPRPPPQKPRRQHAGAPRPLPPL